MKKHNILIVKAGTTNAPVVERHGDYDDWFREILDDGSIEWNVVSPYLSEPLPKPTLFDGILVTGSPSSVWENEPWMRRTIDWLSNIVRKQTTPLLAVCFGHQLVGRALGGNVVVNPKGIELGSISVSLNERALRDPLFAQLPSPLPVYSIHKDIVVDLPLHEDVHLLGKTENTALQAFGVGTMVRAVQFHPELSKPALSMLMNVRGLEATLSDENYGSHLLHNWYKHWI